MELFRLLGTIIIDNEAANRAIDDTTDKANDSSTQTTGAFQKIGAAAGAVARGIGMAGAAIGGAFIAAVEGTREYRTQMGQLESAFVTADHSAGAAKKTYSDLNAVLGDSGQATEAAQQLAKLADSEKELDNWTGILTGVYATFGEALPVEGLAEAANHTAKVGEVQGSLADALEWSGISIDTFNDQLAECSTEQERQKLIMDTLNGTYGEASRQYQETNKDIMDANRAQEQLTDAFAELGRIGEPIMTAIKTKVAEMVTAAVPHIQNFVNTMKDMKTWIQNNESTIKTWASVIAGAVVTIGTMTLALKWSGIMTAAANAVKGLRIAIVALNVAMRANLIGVIISLIAGLVTAFVLLWKNNEGFRNFFLKMWDKIKSATGTAVGWIKGKFSDFKTGLKTVQDTFGKIQTTIKDKLEKARDTVKKVIDKIKGFFNITLKFKGISMPDISISWAKKPKVMYEAAKLLGLDGVPKFSVDWNAEGAVFDRPTIFGAFGGRLQGGGEAGPEAAAPISVLQQYVRSAVRAENSGILDALAEQSRAMMDFLESVIPKQVLLDTGALVGELTPAVDVRLGQRMAHAKRGNTR